MLQEALHYIWYWLRHQPPEAFRAMGYLSECIAIESRYRRQSRPWSEHQAHCHRRIEAAIQQCETHHTAVVLGAGLLLDVPIDALCHHFEKVYLVDVIHMSSARKAAQTFPNIRLVDHDITGSVHAFFRAVKAGQQNFEIGTASLPHTIPAPDLLVSANLLSQLPIIPLRYLEQKGVHDEKHLEALHFGLMHAHLDWLRACPGVKCLLTDTHHLYYDRDENCIDEVTLIDKKRLPEGPSWIWKLAPLGEIYPDKALYHRVLGAIWR